ncbi:hypothetical protein CEXT_442471 [Caerostris extrusa]|uniref:Uncharacterized protein n=1 Tax=Caerostris extrusa TaxID=172846 RepID=A0AAV4X0L8_CAEEX|nr:hypothetical protein CEXT_442471 [Caerostris extrusa]
MRNLCDVSSSHFDHNKRDVGNKHDVAFFNCICRNKRDVFQKLSCVETKTQSTHLFWCDNLALQIRREKHMRCEQQSLRSQQTTMLATKASIAT